MNGHQLQQCKLDLISAGNQFLLSKVFLWLASFYAYRLYEIGPEYSSHIFKPQCKSAILFFVAQKCSPGFRRSGSGPYLGTCEPCDCNGHSPTCDPETGRCYVSHQHRSLSFSLSCSLVACRGRVVKSTGFKLWCF